MNREQILNILQQFQEKKILVIGDIMLDHYIWGKVERISPEAPVPVVEVKKQDMRLGGAANVVNNIRSLGAEPIIIGVVGNDTYSQNLTKIFQSSGITTDGIIQDVSRPTTVKSRIIAHNQQMVRIDNEDVRDIEQSIEDEIIKKIDHYIDTADAIIVEDYNKGLLTQRVIEHINSLSSKKNKILTVDPKFKNFFSYSDCTVFKPNFNELQKNLGITIENDFDFDRVSDQVMKEINPEYLVVTLGEKGVVIYSQTPEFSGESKYRIPTFAKEVYDVSGAGDTTISVLTLCLTIEKDIVKSAVIANHAAGAVCGKIGIQPVRIDDILHSFKTYNSSS